jgi:hypothetical protein
VGRGSFLDFLQVAHCIAWEVRASISFDRLLDASCINVRNQFGETVGLSTYR